MLYILVKNKYYDIESSFLISVIQTHKSLQYYNRRMERNSKNLPSKRITLRREINGESKTSCYFCDMNLSTYMNYSSKLFLAFLTAFLLTGNLSAGCRIERRVMPCKLLQGITEREYSVCLPASYDSQKERTYPVLYLLHGGGCHHTEWEENGRLQAVVDSLVARKEMEEMIIVCPEACKDNMIWFNAPHWTYEDYFFRELIPYIERTYRVKADRNHRGVAGFSMGGGAAVVYGLHHPELFSMVFDMSGYLRRQPLEFLKNDPSAEWRQQVVEDHNPIRTIENASPQQVQAWKTIRWFVDCGDQDFTLEGNMDLVKAFRRQGIGYQMRVRSGGHDWNYWHGSLDLALTYFTQCLPQDS